MRPLPWSYKNVSISHHPVAFFNAKQSAPDTTYENAMVPIKPSQGHLRQIQWHAKDSNYQA